MTAQQTTYTELDEYTVEFRVAKLLILHWINTHEEPPKIAEDVWIKIFEACHALVHNPTDHIDSQALSWYQDTRDFSLFNWMVYDFLQTYYEENAHLFKQTK